MEIYTKKNNNKFNKYAGYLEINCKGRWVKIKSLEEQNKLIYNKAIDDVYNYLVKRDNWIKMKLTNNFCEESIDLKLLLDQIKKS